MVRLPDSDRNIYGETWHVIGVAYQAIWHALGDGGSVTFVG